MKLLQSCRHPALLSRLSALILLGLAAPVFALASALEWTTEEQHFDTNLGDKTIEAAYPFTNTSESQITIIESSASCGCTVPTLEKKVYEPGETGELTAIFTIGSRQGKQHKIITIVTETDDGTQTTYELKLNINIPIPVTLKPRVRFWKINTEATTQDIEITFHEKFPMVITGLKRKDTDEPTQFSYEIETITEGLQYKVKITPLHPNVKSNDRFYLESEENTDILKRYPIYAYVR